MLGRSLALPGFKTVEGAGLPFAFGFFRAELEAGGFVAIADGGEFGGEDAGEDEGAAGAEAVKDAIALRDEERGHEVGANDIVFLA